MKHINLKKVLGWGSVCLILSCILVTGIAKANTLLFPYTTSTATATTTPSFMTPGTATTTLVLDSYTAPGGYANDAATLFIQLSSSSTPTALNTNLEYSQDGVDWFEDGGTMAANYATTTKPFDISQVNQFRLNYASSTAGLGPVSATRATTTRALLVKTPTRFVRAIFTIPIGFGNGSVWASWIPNRQRITN